MIRFTLGWLCVSLICSSISLAADPPASRPAGPDGPRRGMWGPGMQPMGMGGLRGLFAEGEAMMVLAELNLTPEFTLTAEQKTKIAELREAHRKAIDGWQKEHQKEIDALQEKWTAVAKGRDGGKVAELGKAQMELYQSAPKPQDLAAKVKDVLTSHQVKALDDAMRKRQEEREKMMRPWMQPPRRDRDGDK